MKIRTIELPNIRDARGDLVIAEAGRHVPFEIRRVFVIHRVPAGATRARHANRTLHEVLVALSGSFEVHLFDGVDEAAMRVDSPSLAVHVEPMTWIELRNFEPGTVCLVLASEHFDESDHIRDHDVFLRAVGK